MKLGTKLELYLDDVAYGKLCELYEAASDHTITSEIDMAERVLTRAIDREYTLLQAIHDYVPVQGEDN